MKKFIASGLAAALMLGAAAAAEAETLKLAHDNKGGDPFDNPGHACAQVFSSIVTSDTNGGISVEVYPANQLGSLTEQVQMVRSDVIQATIASTGAIASYYPKIDILNMPFAFTDNAATYEVFDGAFGKALKADIETELGDVVVLGYPDTGGFFAVTNSKKPIKDLADFKGIRLRTMTVPAHQVIINALGAEAYPLAWGEVYSAMQTGVIDGQMNPVPIISFANFGEVQDYMTLTNHLFSPYILMVSKTFWDKQDDHNKDILRYAAQSCVAASRGLSRIIEASDRGVAGLNSSLEITALTPEQRAEMRSVTQPAFEQHIEKTFGDKADALLDLFKEEVTKANESAYLE
ncbi:TRAP transporter substrate-binding protein [Rhodobium gokarnense]|uniref:Tripartite ATP-independent transporter DctP family solute receptor n=1 Tax=Rhodobium gokarnense TaxID=364296 RepID=A0ABT3HC50_9HYPH|nr:DctP family TRAP transporter solute-binding subunit [Rhodobium gokarnense]MCW2307971.1 tripartite ATP-independent transporter DctP family solute receptor [Rhodobium gokarnense]